MLSSYSLILHFQQPRGVRGNPTPPLTYTHTHTPSLKLLFACWVIFHHFLSSADIFKIKFFKKLIQEHFYRVSNGLDPDQAGYFLE